MPPSSEFSCSYDRRTILISAAVIAVIVVGCALSQVVWVGIAGLLVVAGSYVLSPRGYAVTEDCILVRRLAGNFRVHLAGAAGIRAAESADFAGSLKTWGNGGLFGYYGRFRTSRLGDCRWFLTNRSKAVVLVKASTPFGSINEPGAVLFSPDDVEGFIAAVRSVAPMPESDGLGLPAESTFDPPRRSVAGAALGIVVGVVSLAVVAAAFLYSPGPPRLLLSRDSLKVQDRFYPVTVPAAWVDVSGIRVVDIARDPEWKPGRRTNGFANAHYHSGWFRTAGGRKARMYWTDGTRLVLLPPRGGADPVLVEARDPEAFAASLKREWRR